MEFWKIVGLIITALAWSAAMLGGVYGVVTVPLLRLLKAEMKILGTEITRVEGTLKTEITRVESTVKAEIWRHGGTREPAHDRNGSPLEPAHGYAPDSPLGTQVERRNE
jgi:hypothetical protein